MQVIRTINSLRQLVRQWRQAEETVGFVPMMGNLHQGHLSLVQEAKRNNDRVIVSIFVNPTQFGAGEDYSTYPRTESEDQIKLEACSVDILFLPKAEALYLPEAASVITVKGLSDIHCGSTRVGHFSGVATIVCKLFNIVQPDEAYFGKKDFQQLAVIQRMVLDLNIPVSLNGLPSVRENDGLAMSSRNAYLTPAERKLAPILFKTLQNAKELILKGQETYPKIEKQQLQNLLQAGFIPEYFSICRSIDLLPAKKNDTELVVLTAVKLGKTRLIDNHDFIKP